MIRVLYFSVFFVLAVSRPAWANNPPAPQSILPEIAIPVIMVILTTIGGGYAIRESRISKGILMAILALFAIVFSAVNEGIPLMVGLFFAVAAFVRGGQMITWGLKARKTPSDSNLSMPASPPRLIVSGILLCLITVFLYGMVLVMSFTFFGTWMSRDKERILLETTAWRMVYLQKISKTPEEKLERNPSEFDADKKRLEHGGYELTESTDQANGDFTFHLTPNKVPFFPYNYFAGFRSYRSDQTGKIRMIKVNWNGQKCPVDAPVILEVQKEDLEKALKSMQKSSEEQN